MITMLNQDQYKNWKVAAQATSKGKPIYSSLLMETKKYTPVGGMYRQLIDQNATLIKTLPYDIAQSVTRKTSKLAIEGKRPEEIAKIIQKDFPKSTKAKANLIARTEVSKASTALTEARSKNIGIKWYVWRTSEDARVRKSHRNMDDVIVGWNDPPSPEQLVKEESAGKYHAGNIYNCRCYPEPIVDLGLIKWPHKVYIHGQIKMMTRAQFEAISGTSAKPSVQQPQQPSKPAASVLKEEIQTIKKETKELKQAAPKQPPKPPSFNVKSMLNEASKAVEKAFETMTQIEVDKSIAIAREFFSANEDERRAFNRYTGSAYEDMNGYFRGKISVHGLNNILAKHMVKMKEGFLSAPKPFDKPTKLFRATGFSFIKNAGLDQDTIQKTFRELGNSWADDVSLEVFANDLRKKMIGKVVEETSFTSTSFEEGAFGSGKDIQLRILADPEVTKAVQLAGISEFNNEAEILFDTGMLNRIEDIEVKRVKNGQLKIYITVRLLGHKDADLSELRRAI